MHAFPIHTDADLHRAVRLIDSLWDVEVGTAEHDLLMVMAQLVESYEASVSTLPAADPRDLLRFKLKELGWSQRELGRRLGWGSGRVSEVLNGKRPLTLQMVKELSRELHLPAGALVHDVAKSVNDGVWVHIPAQILRGLQATHTQSEALSMIVNTAVLDFATHHAEVPSHGGHNSTAHTTARDA